MPSTAKKKRLAFNAMDVLIILAAIAAAAVLLYVFILSEKPSVTADTVTVRYVIEVKTVRDEFTDCVNIGDPVTDNIKLYSVGTVVAYEYRDSVWKGVDKANVTQVIGDYPGMSDMYVTIEAEATEDVDCYNIGGYELTVGQGLYMRLPNFYGLGYCVSVEVID